MKILIPAVNAVLALSLLTPSAFALEDCGVATCDVPPSNHHHHNRNLEFDLSPVFYVDLDCSRKLVNLTPDRSNTIESRNSLFGETAALAALSDDKNVSSLTVDEYSKGFRLLRSRKLEVGLGVAGYWHDNHGPEWQFLPAVGIVPILGRVVLSDQYVQTREEAAQAGALEIPRKAENLKSWRANDSIRYESEGGVLFFAGVHAEAIGVIPMYIVRGTWSTYIEKTGPTTAYMKLTHTHLDNASVAVGNLLTNVDIGSFKDADASFSYSYDLADPVAALAYEDAIKGNLAPTQRLAAQSVVHATSVWQDESSQARRVGNMISLWVGIPYLFENTGSQTYATEFKTTVKHLDGSSSEAQYALFSRDVANRWWVNHHQRRVEAFSSVSYTNVDKKNRETDGDFATYIWSHQNDQTSAGTLRMTIRELIAKTGLHEELAVAVPRDLKDDALGYTSVKFKLTIPQETTDYIASLGKQIQALNAFSASSADRVESYFKSMKDKDKVCSTQEKIDACWKRVSGETEAASVRLTQAIRRMSRSRDLDREKFDKAYRDFGSAMMTNQFTFQTMMGLLKSSPVEINYVVEGERISKYERGYLNMRRTEPSLTDAVPLMW